MTVYVDDSRIPARVGRLSARWSHLTADTEDELHAFAAQLGLKRAWFQICKSRLCRPPCVHWHYDVTDTKRREAIRLGAKAITWREAGRMMLTARRRASAMGHCHYCGPTAEGTTPVRPGRVECVPPLRDRHSGTRGGHRGSLRNAAQRRRGDEPGRAGRDRGSRWPAAGDRPEDEQTARAAGICFLDATAWRAGEEPADDPRPTTGGPPPEFPAGCCCALVDYADVGEQFRPPPGGCPVHTPWAFPGYSLQGVADGRC